MSLNDINSQSSQLNNQCPVYNDNFLNPTYKNQQHEYKRQGSRPGSRGSSPYLRYSPTNSVSKQYNNNSGQSSPTSPFPNSPLSSPSPSLSSTHNNFLYTVPQDNPNSPDNLSNSYDQMYKQFDHINIKSASKNHLNYN